jgi:hypothetical protein
MFLMTKEVFTVNVSVDPPLDDPPLPPAVKPVVRAAAATAATAIREARATLR